MPRVEVSDGFMLRIMKALRMSERQFAKALGLKPSELKPFLTGGRCDLVEIDRHDVWWLVSKLVSEELGFLLAIRGELDKALQKDRAERTIRIQKQRDYHATKSR